MDDPVPVSSEHWLHWLSRVLDPLSGPAPDEAIRALEAVGDHEAIVSLLRCLKRGDLPDLPVHIVQSLESMNETS